VCVFVVDEQLVVCCCDHIPDLLLLAPVFSCWARAGFRHVQIPRSSRPTTTPHPHPRLRHQHSQYSTPIREIGFVVDCETPSIHPTPFIQLLPSLPWPQLRASRSPSLVTRVSNCSRARRTGRMVMLSSSRSLLCRSKFVSNSHLIQLRLEYEANSYTLHR
jgi:hypothetical protein